MATLGESLQLLFASAATDISHGLTDDPAGVSGKIKLPDGMTCTRSAKRLRFFADKVQEALDNTDDRAVVESALAELYPEQLPNAERSANAKLANAMRRGNKDAIRSGLAIAPAAVIKPTRSYGDDASAS